MTKLWEYIRWLRVFFNWLTPVDDSLEWSLFYRIYVWWQYRPLK